MDWLEMALAMISLACSGFLYLRNRSLSFTMEELKDSITKNKSLYVICPKCGTKILLTLDSVKEEDTN